MLKAGGDRGCCDRCAGATGTADAARVARRRLFKDAVFGLTPDLAPDPGPLGREGDGPGASGQGPGSGPAEPGLADGGRLPRAVTGTVLDVSPHVLVIGDLDGPGPEQRFTLTADAMTWRGGQAEPTLLHQGDQAVVRLHPSQRAVVDRIWANIGRVTGTIVELGRDFMIVDDGAIRRRQTVRIPARAAGRIQVRFPTLQPGYLIDVIGLRQDDHLEGLIPATSQPAYPADRLPEPPLISGHVPDTISGSATWHEPTTGEPPGVLGAYYPALDPETGCVEDTIAGYPRGYARMPYLAVGSALMVRNDCSGTSCVLPVTGCAAVARLFNDRCVTCGTSPRGRVADLTQASFVALGGELDKGCFNATISIGR
ncbi:MAG TPA: hypothetical protein VHU92_16510 [Streptosporangiaceae bacterium]|nr:hypothetical protein [Streptosporangiaceae bacterium]